MGLTIWHFLMRRRNISKIVTEYERNVSREKTRMSSKGHRGEESLLPGVWKWQQEGPASWGRENRKAWVGSSSVLWTAAQEKMA